MQDEQTEQSYSGKNKITSPERKNFSKRAAKGNLIIEKTETTCKKCGHDKTKTNMSAGSPIFGITRCTKCGAKR